MLNALAAIAATLCLGSPSEAMTYREAVESLLPRLSEPEPPGEVLFAEDFERGSLEGWTVDAGWKVVDAPDGGHCGEVTSSDDHEDLVLNTRIAVALDHPIALVCKVRRATGNADPYLRLDFVDADGNTGEPYAHQTTFPARSEWADAVLLISDWFPEYTRAVTIHFHLQPDANATLALDDIRVVDLFQAADERVQGELSDRLAKLLALRDRVQALPPDAGPDPWRRWLTDGLAQAEAGIEDCRDLQPGTPAFSNALARPASAVARLTDALAALESGEPKLSGAAPLLVYATQPMPSTMVLPYSAELTGVLAQEVRLRACVGEYESASIVLWAPEDIADLTVRVQSLSGPGGAIPARNVDIRWVKCWYQAGSAPHGVGQDRGRKVLVPELLLKDDSLVEVDLDGELNRLKLSFPDGPRYIDVNDPTDVPWGWKAALEDYPVRDAQELQPLDLPARRNKQVWLTVRVPDGARPGAYRGRLSILAGGKRLVQLPFVVEVLPFSLAPPRTHYDIDADFTGSLYYWGELDPTGAGTIGFKIKSEEQFRAELRHMFEHNIVAPTMILGSQCVYEDEALFRKTLSIMRETGLSGRPLHFGGSDMIGAPTGPAELEALKERIERTLATAREYGFPEVYFYGLDEASGDRLRSQRAAWEAVHEAGGKVIVSAFRGQFEAVGDILDLCNWAGPPDPALAPLWHGQDAKMWNYANPQTPVEDPAVYRRNYGFVLWKADYDGACTYCYMDSSGTPWNDFDCNAYRDHNVAYPTVDGIVPTLALEGYREAFDDVKYATTLRLAAARAEAGASADALEWLESIDPHTADLDATRAEMIRRIIALN